MLTKIPRNVVRLLDSADIEEIFSLIKNIENKDIRTRTLYRQQLNFELGFRNAVDSYDIQRNNDIMEAVRLWMDLTIRK